MCRCGVWRALCCRRHGAPVVSDPVRPHGPQPTRLRRPWDSPGGSTGAGAISFSDACKRKAKVKVKSCPTLCDPMDRSPPGSAVPGILQAGALERVPSPSPDWHYWARKFLSPPGLYGRSTRFKKAKWIPKACGAKTPLALKDTKSHCRKCVLTRGQYAAKSGLLLKRLP